jgi:response regulator RpfG family c-di-GMP phosphodiesterase
VARPLATALGVKNVWQIELAAMLAQIGYITLPVELRQKILAGEVLLAEEQQLLQRVPEISFRLISHIPRMEPVAEMVRFSAKAYDGSGPPKQAIAGEQIPLGSRILKVLNDLAELEKKDYHFEAAIRVLQSRKGQYDEKIIYTIHQKHLSLSSHLKSNQFQGQTIGFSEMQVGDYILSDIATMEGKLLLRAGNTINQALLEGLTNYSRLIGLREPIEIKRRIGPAAEE